MKCFIMKIIIFITLLTLGKGCVDKKPKIILNHSFCLNSELKAINLAQKEWYKIYGESNINKKKPFIAELKNDTLWIIKGTLPKNYLGGVPYAEINAKTCEVIKITHGK